MITIYQLKKIVDMLDSKAMSENNSLSPSQRDKYRKDYLMGKKIIMERIGEVKYWRVIGTLEGMID